MLTAALARSLWPAVLIPTAARWRMASATARGCTAFEASRKRPHRSSTGNNWASPASIPTWARHVSSRARRQGRRRARPPHAALGCLRAKDREKIEDDSSGDADGVEEASHFVMDGGVALVQDAADTGLRGADGWKSG